MAEDKPDEEPTGPDERAVWPALATLWVWVLGWLPLGAETLGHPFPVALMWLLAVVFALFGVWWSGDHYSPRIYGPAMHNHGAVFAGLCAVGAGWWWYRAGTTSPWAQTFLLIGMGLIGGAGWWVLCSRAERAAMAEERHEELMATLSDVDAMRLILWQAGAYDVLVHEVRPTRAGYTAVLGPDPAAPRRVTYALFSSRISDIATNLGMYHREKEGVELEDTDVRLIPVKLDRWELYVSTRHVLRETVPFDMSLIGKPFGAGILLGLLEDGAEIILKLLGNHLKLVGMTGGGKSVILRNILARCIGTRDARTGDPDCLVWVAATAKLVPLVWNFLAPYLSGAQRRPVLDWVAGQDPKRVREFLVCLYAVVQDRNDALDEDDKVEVSSATPAIVCVLEEGKVLCGSKEKITTGDGREWQTGELINEILTLGRSAAVSIIIATQQGLYTGGLGQWGDQMMRNLTLRLCTATMTDSDGRSTLSAMPVGVDTTRLKHHSLYYQPGIGEDARAMPGKAALIEKDAVGPIVARYGDKVAVLEASAVAAIDEAAGADGYYGGRWDQERLPELARAMRRRGWLWPTAPAVAPVPAPAASPAPPAAAAPPVTPPAPPAPPAPPVATPPTTPPAGPAGGPAAPRAEDAPGGGPWSTDWDRELTELAKGPDAAGTSTREAPGLTHAPSDVDALSADVARIEQLAAKAHEEADAWLAAHGDPTAPDVDAPATDAVDTTGLPSTMAAVLLALRQLQAQGHAQRWVATGDLALVIHGCDDRDTVAELGRSLRAEAVPVELVATGDRPRISGRRGRGFHVADVEAAIAAKRTRAS